MIILRQKKGEIHMELRKLLLLEQERLAKILMKARKDLENAPKGTLRLGKSQGCTQYYLCKPGLPHNGDYLAKRNMELAKQLAQKSYNQKIMRYSERNLKQISKLLRDYEDDKIEKIFLAEHPERQKLISPVEPTFQQRIEDWISKPYLGKRFTEEMPVIMTNSGIRVRSKSEKIMADYFDSIGLAYKYECPLQLAPYGAIYPDFTFLSKRTGREVYWEHEGMLDKPEYARTAAQKMELYEINGIYPGENLILTFETSTTVLNTELMKSMVNRYLM